MTDMDEILKKALTPTQYPSDELNEKVFSQIKTRMTELEKIHAKRIKSVAAALIALCLLIIPVSVYTAYKYLLPEEAAKEMGDRKLEQAFERKGEEVLQTVTDGQYKVTYLGHVTGESISDRTGYAWELNPERLYVAVAIEKVDGTKMNYDEKFFVSPLIQGLVPWKYNIVTMNGSYMAQIIDGILYRIIECDNIEIFADRKLYLAVSDTLFFSDKAFSFDEATGEITANDDFDGTNVLFDLVLDPSKADPVKAQEYLEQFEAEWSSGFENGDGKAGMAEDKDEDEMIKRDLKEQQEYYTDEENGFTIRIKDNNSHRWSAGPEYSQTILQYYLEVIGDNIDTLTFTLNKGEFSNFPEHSISKAEHYGNECSLSYDEQKDRNYLYAIHFKGFYRDYGYDPEEVQKLGAEGDARSRIYYEVLDKAISDTKMTMKIKVKDGREIIKNVYFKNVSDNERSFRIVIEVE